MIKKYRKVPLNPEVFEDGGATGVFIDKETIPLDGSVQDAVDGNYAIGNVALIRNTFFGLMKSMADGVRRDGRPRQIAGLITVYPVFKGPVDLEKGFDPAVNGVMIRARLLKEIDIDITKWSFEDDTPGKRAFALTTVKGGEVDGEVVIGSAIEINGKNVPNKSAGEEIRVSWTLADGSKYDDVADAKITGNISRIDLAEGAISSLTDDDVGKEIEFTVRGNFSNAKIKAVVRASGYQPAPTVELASINGEEAAVETRETSYVKPDEGMTFDAWFDSVDEAPTLKAVTDDTCDWWFEKDGVRHEGQMTKANGGLENKGDDELMMYVPVAEAANLDVGDVVHYHAVLHGGVNGSRPQVFDFTSTVREE